MVYQINHFYWKGWNNPSFSEKKSIIFVHRILCFLPASHRLAKDPSPIDLKEIENDDFIIPPRSHEPGYYDTIITICNKAGIFPKIHQEAEGLTTILALASAGIGVSLVSRFAMETQWKELAFREFKGFNTNIDLFLACRKNNDLPIVRNFVNVARNSIQI